MILTEQDVAKIIRDPKNVKGNNMLPFSFAQEIEAAVLAALKARGPKAWQISYAGRSVVCGHNCVADYRDIDAQATAVALYPLENL